HHILGFFHQRVGLVPGGFQAADCPQGRGVKGVIIDHFANRAFALGEVGGDGAGVAQDVVDVGAVLFHEVGNRPEQSAEVIGAETLGESFDAAGDAIDSGHEGAEVGLLGAFEGGAGEDLRGGGGTALEGDKII